MRVDDSIDKIRNLIVKARFTMKSAKSAMKLRETVWVIRKHRFKGYSLKMKLFQINSFDVNKNR